MELRPVPPGLGPDLVALLALARHPLFLFVMGLETFK